MKEMKSKTQTHRICLKAVAALLIICLLASCLAGCASTGKNKTALTTGSKDLMQGVRTSSLKKDPETVKDHAEKAADFALRLFNACQKDGENTLVSPLSVMNALGLVQNGAVGQTLSQMEDVLGFTQDELNTFMQSYRQSLPSGKKYKLSLANSIWLRDGAFEANTSFLQTNADYYSADVYKAAFDENTAKDINSWVDSNTDGMIPSIIDRIPDNAQLYLINALAFDAEWEEPFREDQVHEREFTCADGSKKTVDFMYPETYSGSTDYLETDGAEGLIRYYKDKKYAFVALLPAEGTSPAQLAASLTGEKLLKMLESPSDVSLIAGLPKFELSWEADLSDILSGMGMPEAFSLTAEFSRIGNDANFYIDSVIHKSYISVDEKGTRAGAATAVAVNTSAPMIEKTVILDRPFLYMLIDCETNIPFFIGVLEYAP